VRTPARAPRAFTRGEGCTSSSPPFLSPPSRQRGLPCPPPSPHPPSTSPGFLRTVRTRGPGRREGGRERERREEVKVCMRARVAHPASSPPPPPPDFPPAAALRLYVRTCRRRKVSSFIKITRALSDRFTWRTDARCVCVFSLTRRVC